MLVNPTPTELIEVQPNKFMRIQFIWLVPKMLYHTELIGFGFKDEADLQNYKDGLGNQSFVFEFLSSSDSDNSAIDNPDVESDNESVAETVFGEQSDMDLMD